MNSWRRSRPSATARTITLFLAYDPAAIGGFPVIGWAKPTPVNPMNLRGGRRGEAMVAAARLLRQEYGAAG